MTWDDVSFLLASKYRRKIVIALLDGPKTPSAISRQVNIRMEHVTRTLRELEGKNLTVCLTPKSRRGRLYDLTKKGREVIAMIPKTLAAVN